MNAPQLTGNVNKNTILLFSRHYNFTKHRNEKEWLKTTVMVSVQDDAA